MSTSGVVKQIICLANSRKMSGRCIAGKEVLADGKSGGWIRPVSDRENQEVSEWERQYQDGSDPRVLDVLHVPLLSHTPKDYQQENWLLDPDFYWEKTGQVTANGLSQYTDPVEVIWVNGHHTYNGRNDRIPLHEALAVDNSLCLIQATSLEIVVSQPGRDFGNTRRSVQGRFQYRSAEYWLRITDPVWERDYLAKPDGSYSIGRCFLTVSLGEPYRGFVYKLIAAIIPA